ncbi:MULTISPECIES: type VII toxin-antitoxin system MntA family adenylyltransferase antitoxin [Calothrix]|uniref:Nucleotidyltransferase domain-containing protein n=2 Tax=Calothrix TaxID=1186 RepID=A0ABR8AAV5_9CYAN|nr:MULTISPECIES: nucleotidyltransferase domain-containing protein [Calothrix]MBD2196819.1 nucleotidyltransferase domain-containing protein [Calothrix parietina FACHB-288]MBD2225371.1 nucleotidyltransferase domain-containing protein [Calothrix anomala FACHB-343]
MQNPIPTIAELQELASQLPEKIPYLKMLILFGSRATGNANAKSDWDFAVLCDEEQREAYIKNNISGLFELPMLIGEVLKINADHIDIVELNQCSWLIAHFVARDGILLFEKYPEQFESFRLNSLKTESELKKFRQEQHQIIERELNKWGA